LTDRGIPGNLGISGPDDLKSRLKRALADNEVMWWLSVPFLRGLAEGGDAINQKISIPYGNWHEPLPILHWLCQYKLLHAQGQYGGKDDMVGIALRVGARVNAKLANNCTALFFAVKYASPKTVELLLEAGADATVRDVYGHSCWKNAIEHPSPDTIKLLLNAGPTAAQERINTHTESSGIIQLTLPDLMLSAFVGQEISDIDGSRNDDPVSWRILGQPKLDDYATSLLLLLRGGATFSSDSLPLASCYHAMSPLIGLSPSKSEYMKHLSMAIFGDWLPDVLRREAMAYPSVNSTSSSTCLICLNAMGDRDDPITLYCGHSFCCKCIRRYGQSDAGSSVKRCPACRRLLCRELQAPRFRHDWFRVSNVFGIDRYEAMNTSGERGPSQLTDDQLEVECQARGIEATSREEKIAKLKPASFFCPKAELELSTTTNILAGDGKQYMAPKDGPVAFPITVKNITVLARVSTTSPLTVISNKFVEMFGLKKTNLISKEFVVFNGQQLNEGVTVIKDFAFRVGDIEVCLNNTVSYDYPDDSTVHGVQLGVDFLQSAAWTQYCVRVDMKVSELDGSGMQDNVFAIADGGSEVHVVVGECRREELRYYARNGRTFQTPFIHIRNFADTGSIPVFTLMESVRFTECEWCCRFFPTGMLPCVDCGQSGRSVHYCDEECRENASKIHEHG